MEVRKSNRGKLQVFLRRCGGRTEPLESLRMVAAILVKMRNLPEMMPWAKNDGSPSLTPPSGAIVEL